MADGIPASERLTGNGPSAPVLLYDGECGVCSASIQWILRHERQHHLLFSPLQSQLGKQLRASAGVSEKIDSLLWIDRSLNTPRASKWSGAVLKVLCYVGWPYSWLTVMWWIPAPARDAAYRLFARYRKKIAPSTCLLPSPQQRARFVDA